MPENFLQYRVQTSTPEPIEFLASNPQGVELDRSNPIMEIECVLSGTVTIGSAAATALKDGGLWNLIQTLTLRIGGDRNVIRIPGKLIPYIATVYGRHAPLVTQPGLTTAAHDFRAFFTLPINPFVMDQFGIADWRGCLDPTAFGRAKITLEVTWAADASVMLTPDGSTTFSLSNTKVAPKVYHSKTNDVRIPGGLGWDQYVLHLLTSDSQPITGSMERLPIALDENVVHSRLILATEQDNVLVDTILNSLSIGAGESGYQTIDAVHLQDQNAQRYGLSSRQTGVYVVDFNRLGFAEQMLKWSGATRLQAWLNVTKPGTGTDHTLTYVQDRFVQPSAA